MPAAISIFDSDSDELDSEDVNETTPALLAARNPVPLDPSRHRVLCLLAPFLAALVILLLVSRTPATSDHSLPLSESDSAALQATDSPTATSSPFSTQSPTLLVTASPTTTSPTTGSPAPPTTTLSPTSPPVDDSPVQSLDDARYGPEVAQFSVLRARTWLGLAHNRSDFGRTWKTINSSLTPDQLHANFCLALAPLVPKLKYHEPDWTGISSKVGPEVLVRHYNQYRAYIADYYELPTGLPVTASAAAVDNIAAVFARVLKRADRKLVLGFQGSSVMSGQDNCHWWIYSEFMKREMTKILRPFGVTIEVRNMGQNGDGPDQMTQLLCAPDTMGSGVDILTLWYPMMPDSSVQEKALFLRRVLARQTFVHLMTFEGRNWNEFAPWLFWVTQDWFDQGEYKLAIHWGGGWEGGWGKRGDGRCHVRTREDEEGIWMHNWHFGPLGFQMLVDTAINTYVLGLVRSLRAPEKAVWNANLPARAAWELPWGSPRYGHISADKFNVVCATGYGPRWSAEGDVNASFFAPLTDSRNPFPRHDPLNASAPLQGGAQARWSFARVKNPSTNPWPLSVLRSKDPLAACNNFVDIGYAFVLPYFSGYSEWLTFALPAQSALRLKGFAKMDVLICAGQRWHGHGLNRDGGYDKALDDVTVQYGAHGVPVGPARNFTSPYLFTSCFAIAQAVPALSQGEYFGLHVLKRSPREGPLIQTILLIGVPDS